MVKKIRLVKVKGYCVKPHTRRVSTTAAQTRKITTKVRKVLPANFDKALTLDQIKRKTGLPKTQIKPAISRLLKLGDAFEPRRGKFARL